MSPPAVRVNTLFQVHEPCVDRVSKLFIITQFLFGVNRLPVLGNKRKLWLLLSLLYTILLIVFFLLTVFTSVLGNNFVSLVIIALSFCQYSFVIAFSFFTRRRIQAYHKKLREIDAGFKCSSKIGTGAFTNVVCMVLSIAYCSIILSLSFIYPEIPTFYPPLMPVVLTHILELYHYGHLLCLLIPRIYIANYYLEMTLPYIKKKIYKLKNKNVPFIAKKNEIGIDELAELICMIFEASDILNNAIKWQFFLMLIESFVTSLVHSYFVTLNIIRYGGDFNLLLSYLGQWIGIILPLFSPCIYANKVRCEAKRIRELVASKLYEDGLDKDCRRVARALLAWTDSRDFSISLLRIVKVDISLPFKFVGLLVTYLIILLQFEKVINP